MDQQKNQPQQDISVLEKKTQKRKTLWQNVGLIAFCIVCAFGLWLYVMNVDSPEYEEEFTAVSVEIMTRAADGTESPLSAISGGGILTDVTLRGRKTMLAGLSASDIHAYVDISAETNPGRGTYPIVVDTPNGATVVDYSPRDTSLYLDRKSSKNVPVTVEVTNYTYSSDCYIGDKIPSVDNVLVSGPESELAEIESAKITLSPGGTVTQSFTGSAAPVLLDAQGNEVSTRYLTVNVSQITATVKVMKTKEVPLTVTNKYGFFDNANAAVTIEPAAVKLRGEVSDVDGINSVELMQIDETLVDTPVWKRTVQIKLPQGIESEDGETDADVTVVIGTNVKMRSLASGAIAVKNAPSGVSYRTAAEKVQVTVRGNAQRVDDLTSADLSAVLDLSELSSVPGSYVVPVTVTPKGGNTKGLYVIGEYSVTVIVD